MIINNIKGFEHVITQTRVGALLSKYVMGMSSHIDLPFQIACHQINPSLFLIFALTYNDPILEMLPHQMIRKCSHWINDSLGPGECSHWMTPIFKNKLRLKKKKKKKKKNV